MGENHPKDNRPPGRLHSILPAPPWNAGREGTLAGIDVLQEVDGDLGIVLWRALRDLEVWTSTPLERRSLCFRAPPSWSSERCGSAQQTAPELVAALECLALVPSRPTKVLGFELAAACNAVHEWAWERGFVRTAVLFAEAAAYADPADPAYANFAARMCRRALHVRRGADWYQRAFSVAIRTRNRKEAIYSQLGYGSMMKDLGRYPDARRSFERAARRAARKNHREEAAEARHDLCCLEAEIGAWDAATRYARMALSIYPLRAARLPLLAQDYAYVLIRQEHFLVAHALLERTIPFIQRPEEQALVWSTLAWAAAAAGRRERFAEVEPIILERIQVHADFAAAALIHLSEGSRALCAWDAAVRYAGEAAEVARKRGDVPLQREARDLMTRAASRAPHPTDVPASEETDAFARRLASRLRRWRAPRLASSGASPP